MRHARFAAVSYSESKGIFSATVYVPFDGTLSSLRTNFFERFSQTVQAVEHVEKLKVRGDLFIAYVMGEKNGEPFSFHMELRDREALACQRECDCGLV